MSQRTPSHCSAIDSSVSTTAERSSGENAFSCTTSGQAGKYGSRPFASTRPPTSTKDAGSRAGRPRCPGRSTRGARRPRVVGRDVVRHEVEQQPDAAVGQRRARGGEPTRPAEVRVDRRSRGRSTASRRTSSVAKPGSASPEARRQARVREGDRDPGRAPLPHAHQPDGVEPKRGDRVPLAPGDARQVDRAAARDGSARRATPRC